MADKAVSSEEKLKLEKGTQLLKVLKEAIKAESDGYYFYQMAEEKSKDPSAKEVFRSMALDELDHGSVLKGLYHALMKKSEFKFDRRRHPRGKFKTGSQKIIFSAKLKNKLKQNNFALSALRIAQMREKDAISFYGRHAKQSKHPELKSLFNFLVEWETDHLWALVRQESILERSE